MVSPSKPLEGALATPPPQTSRLLNRKEALLLLPPPSVWQPQEPTRRPPGGRPRDTVTSAPLSSVTADCGPQGRLQHHAVGPRVTVQIRLQRKAGHTHHLITCYGRDQGSASKHEARWQGGQRSRASSRGDTTHQLPRDASASDSTRRAGAGTGAGAILAKGTLPRVNAWCLHLLHAQALCPRCGQSPAHHATPRPHGSLSQLRPPFHSYGDRRRHMITQSHKVLASDTTGLPTPSSWGLRPPTRDQTPPSASGCCIPPTGPPGKSSTSNFLFAESPTPF